MDAVRLYVASGVTSVSSTVLSENEREQMNRFSSEVIASTYCAAHTTLRILLGRALGCCPNQVPFGRDTSGKPVLNASCPLHFNLSRSDKCFAIAVSTEPVGVDIERRREDLEVDALVLRALAETELHKWMNVRQKEKVPSFYWYWTRKEALLKLTGEGILTNLRFVDTENGEGTRGLSTIELQDITLSCATYDKKQCIIHDIGQGIPE